MSEISYTSDIRRALCLSQIYLVACACAACSTFFALHSTHQSDGVFHSIEIKQAHTTKSTYGIFLCLPKLDLATALPKKQSIARL